MPAFARDLTLAPAPGRLRGLAQLSGPAGLLAFALLHELAPLTRVAACEALAPHLPAVCLDRADASEAILAGALPGRTGLLIDLGPDGRLDPKATPATIRRLGGSAAFLRIQPRPGDGLACARAGRLARAATALCAEEDLPLVLQVALPEPEPWHSMPAGERARLVLRSLGPLGADLLVLPAGAGEASPLPWLCALGSTTSDELARELDAALALGARGFALGAAALAEPLRRGPLDDAAPLASSLREHALARRA